MLHMTLNTLLICTAAAVTLRVMLTQTMLILAAKAIVVTATALAW